MAMPLHVGHVTAPPLHPYQRHQWEWSQMQKNSAENHNTPKFNYTGTNARILNEYCMLCKSMTDIE
jgi:hypothetical protein